MKLSRKLPVIFIVGFVLLFFIVLCISHYTKNAVVRYKDQNIRAIDLYGANRFMWPRNYTSCTGENFIISLHNDRTMSMSLFYRDPSKNNWINTVKITDFEYCIIYDCLYKCIIPLGDKYYDDNYTKHFKIFLKTRTSSYLCLRGRCLNYLLFAWLIFLPFYIRRTLPQALLLFIVFYILIKKNKQHDYKTSLKFTLISCFAMLLSELSVRFVSTAIFIEKTPISKLFIYRNITPFNNVRMGVNIKIFILFVILQLIVLNKTQKQTKIRTAISFIVPTLIMFLLHCLLFRWLLGSEKASIFFGSAAVFFRSFLGINEGAGIHALFAAFTLFFPIAFVVYGLFSDKQDPERFARTMGFAFTNAFMTCLGVYILNFSTGITAYICGG